MKNKRNFIYLCIFYLLYYVTIGVFSPYINVYYERLGFSGSQIGTINALGYILAMCCTPLWGIITDKTHKYKGMIAFLLIATAASMVLWTTQKIYIYVLITSIFVYIFKSPIGSIADGFSVQLCKEDNSDYSIIRSMGSLGYLLGAFVIANIMLQFNIQGPYVQVVVVCAILGSIVLCFLPSPKEFENKDKLNLKEGFKHLLQNKAYLWILLFMSCTTMVMDNAVNYAGNHLVSTLNQSDAMIGIFSCAMVLPEVFIVMKANALFRRVGLKKMYIIACVCQIVRCVVYAFTNNIFLFMLVSTMHGIMIAVGCVGNVRYIHRNVELRVLATAMAIYSAITTIGSAIVSQIMGMIYQQFGSYSMFLFVGVVTCIALIMAIQTKHLDNETI